jgi:hypothetical protein
VNEDFLDFIRLMSKHDVDFVLVGGYAYILNVEARYTGDIDFWVRPTRENIERLNLAAEAFLGSQFDVDEVLDLMLTSRLGFTLAGIKPNMIEILLRVSGLEYESTKARARLTQDREIAFYVMHPHDQIINKRASNRDKDKIDVKNLVKLYGEPSK